MTSPPASPPPAFLFSERRALQSSGKVKTPRTIAEKRPFDKRVNYLTYFDIRHKEVRRGGRARGAATQQRNSQNVPTLETT